MPSQALRTAEVGAVLPDIWEGRQPGHFGWLTWTGHPSVPTLVQSLTPPGNSAAYLNPHHPADHVISPGDWVLGKPGVANSKNVREALDRLKRIDIVAPVWDRVREQEEQEDDEKDHDGEKEEWHERERSGKGSDKHDQDREEEDAGERIAYRVCAFARVRLLSYQLAGQNRIRARFLGYVLCAGANQAPEAVAQWVTTSEDQPLALTLTGNDSEGAGLSFAVVNGPSHGSLSGTVPNVVYTPEANYNGPDSFTFKVNDGQLDSVPASVTITVAPVNDPPVANGQAVVTDEDRPVGITLSGADAEGSALAFTILAGPDHGSLSGPAPSLVYTPEANYNGPDSFTFKVNDGSLDSAPASVTITVAPVNDPPVANGQVVVADEDGAVGVTLSGTDVEGNTLAFAILAGPSHGSLSGTAPNLTYTPTPNFNGADAFTFKVHDGQADSATATISISVTPVNDAPVAQAQTQSTLEDTPLDLTLTGTDVEGDTLTYAIVSSPAHGSWSGTGPNVTYTPAPDYNGGDSFTSPSERWGDGFGNRYHQHHR
ncbi:MAG: Ig-like domain-containing protein, partial [Verrucomicrobiota bacterium]